MLCLLVIIGVMLVTFAAIVIDYRFAAALVLGAVLLSSCGKPLYTGPGCTAKQYCPDAITK